MYKIAILASGSGSNAENIVKYFQGHSQIQIVEFLTNNPQAFVIERAKKLNIPYTVFAKEEFQTPEFALALKQKGVTHIVLAGFLWLIPVALIQQFPSHMVNIHPALLPKFGGKGMYGDRVHKAVVENKETESGITIHLVNEEYDKGTIVFQARCQVLPTDNFEQVAQKVHALEYEHFPQVIEKWILNK